MADEWGAADMVGRLWTCHNFERRSFRVCSSEAPDSLHRFQCSSVPQNQNSGYISGLLGMAAYKSSLASVDNVRVFTDELEKFAILFSSNPNLMMESSDGDASTRRKRSLENLLHNLLEHNEFLRIYNSKFFLSSSEVPLHTASITAIEKELNIVSNKIRAESGQQLEAFSAPLIRHCSYLNINADVSLQPYGSTGVVVFDVSSRIKESPAVNHAGLLTVQADELFKPGTVFLGMGVPNVYMAHVYGPKDVRVVAAKSLYREQMSVVQSHGRVQSGVLLVPRNLTDEEKSRVGAIAVQSEGNRSVTCLYENLSILATAGFTIDGRDITSYRLPHVFLDHVLRGFVVRLNDKVVEFDFVKTTTCSLNEYYETVKAAVRNTPLRHLHRANDTEEAKEERRRIAMEITEENLSRMDLLRESKELADHAEVGPTFNVLVSETGSLGEFFRSLWGAHVIYKIQLWDHPSAYLIDEYLPESLKEFDIPNMSLASSVKKNVLFTQSVVDMIRHQMANNFTEQRGFTEYNLLKLLTPEPNGANLKYNIVLTRRELIVVSNNTYYGFVDWVLTKHVLISGYAHDVKYAGEIWRGENDVIYINNNSGTYRPTNEMLEKIVELAKKLFPNLNIVGSFAQVPAPTESSSSSSNDKEEISSPLESQASEPEMASFYVISDDKDASEDIDSLRQSMGLHVTGVQMEVDG